MKCGCGYQFVLDPKECGFGDARIAATVAKVSSKGECFFTSDQLYAVEVLRGVRQYRRTSLMLVVATGVVAPLAWLGGLTWLALALGVVCAIAVFKSFTGTGQPTDRERWDAIIDKALASGSFPGLSKLLRRPELGEPPKAGPEPDLFDYGVERILIVERDLLVDLFVRNEFHATERCLVLSESGYPSYIANYAKQCLDERVDLPVFTLHDLAPTAPHPTTRLARALGRPASELRRHKVVDLGLTSETVKQMRPLARYSRAIGSDRTPLDALPYLQLRGRLATCLAQGLALSALLAERTWASHDSSSMSFG